MKKFLAVLSVFALPAFAFAQTAAGSRLINILLDVKAALNILIPILIAAAVAFFIYGVLKYVLAKSDDIKTEGRNAMINGIIGLFVIVSVWGLVALIGSTIGVSPNTGAGGVDIVPDVTGY